MGIVSALLRLLTVVCWCGGCAWCDGAGGVLKRLHRRRSYWQCQVTGALVLLLDDVAAALQSVSEPVDWRMLTWLGDGEGRRCSLWAFPHTGELLGYHQLIWKAWPTLVCAAAWLQTNGAAMLNPAADLAVASMCTLMLQPHHCRTAAPALLPTVSDT
jgi:hypothetical protein